MEESEKRRERLRAMRTEASQAGATSETSSGFHQLSNPLIESAVTPSMQSNPHGATRFDYYTDPMAAFSNDKRISKGRYQNSPGSYNRFPTPRNPDITPSPAHHQVRPAYSPDPRMYQPRSPNYNPRQMYPEMTPSPGHHIQSPYSPYPGMDQQPQNTHYYSGPINPSMPPAHQGQSGNFQTQPPYHSSHANIQPPYSPYPGMGQQPQNPYNYAGSRNPSMSPAQKGQSGHFQTQPPYHSSHANIQPPYSPNPGMDQQPQNPYNYSGPGNPSMSPAHKGQSGHSQTRPPYHSSSANSPSSGRGKGRSGSGRGGKRGFNSHLNVSAELRPDLFYDKSMVEDPWKNLEPSIWKVEVISGKGVNAPDSRKTSHSGTFETKKARIMETSKESSSQPSLAEYLAAAFNETVGEESNGDKSICDNSKGN